MLSSPLEAGKKVVRKANKTFFSLLQTRRGRNFREQGT